MYSCLAILERSFSGSGGKVGSWWGTANAAWLTWPWEARGRLGTSWSCEEPPSCIVFEGCCRFCFEALNAALLVGLAGERSGMLANKPGASLQPEHWGPTASAMCWRSWRMRIDVLCSVLVHSVVFENPFGQDSPCSSGDKITCQGQKNERTPWEGLKFDEQKVCGIQTCRTVPKVQWTRRHTRKYK